MNVFPCLNGPFRCFIMKPPSGVIPAERRAAVRELCQPGSSVHSSALASLAVLLEDEDDAVREGAADVLTKASQRGGAALDTVLEVFARMLADGNIVARMKAANLLSRIGPGARPLIPALIEALRGKNLILCRMAAQTHQIGPARFPRSNRSSTMPIRTCAARHAGLSTGSLARRCIRPPPKRSTPADPMEPHARPFASRFRPARISSREPR